LLSHRRIARPLALACATATVAAAPSTALARPAIDPPAPPAGVEPQTVVREVQTGNDQTVPLILSGSALLVAFAGAGYAGSSRRRVDRIAHPQV
jgi:hypothetical protein